MEGMKKIFATAPLLLLAYGIVRLIDGADGNHGPGLAWTIGHLLFLAGFLLYAAVLVGLRRLIVRGRGLATVAVVAGLIGVVAFVRVIVIDLIVGIRAADPAAMDRIGDEYDRWPGNLGIYDTFYEIGPLLFLLGLLTLAILLTVARKLPVWSPVLLALGFVLITINLDLMPLGAAALLIAVLPLVTSRQPDSREAGLPAGR
jgi:hypothetical protein